MCLNLRDFPMCLQGGGRTNLPYVYFILGKLAEGSLIPAI